jgi:ribonuclease HI
MSNHKYHVVTKGNETGIFSDQCSFEEATRGFREPEHVSFPTLKQAELFYCSPIKKPQPNGYDFRKLQKALAKKKILNGKKLRRAKGPSAKFDVHIFCDGSCYPNLGPAASGIVVYTSTPKWDAKGWDASKVKARKNSALIKRVYRRYLSVKKNVTLSSIKAHNSIEGSDIANRLSTFARMHEIGGVSRFTDIAAMNKKLPSGLKPIFLQSIRATNIKGVESDD